MSTFHFLSRRGLSRLAAIVGVFVPTLAFGASSAAIMFHDLRTYLHAETPTGGCQNPGSPEEYCYIYHWLHLEVKSGQSGIMVFSNDYMNSGGEDWLYTTIPEDSYLCASGDTWELTVDVDKPTGPERVSDSKICP